MAGANTIHLKNLHPSGNTTMGRIHLGYFRYLSLREASQDAFDPSTSKLSDDPFGANSYDDVGLRLSELSPSLTLDVLG